MKHASIRTLLSGLAALAALCLVPVAVADKPHFSAVYDNTFVLTEGDPETPDIRGKVIEGAGFNSLLGESSVRFEGVIDLSLPPPFAIEGVTTFTVEDADGSIHQLFAETTGLVIPGETPGLLQLDYHYVFTHGTGKFADVKGGWATVLGAATFQSDTGGSASWCMTGFLRR